MSATKFDDNVAEVAIGMAREGATDQDMAEALGIALRTFRYWKNRYPEWKRKLQDAKDCADELVEASLYMSAVGYSHEETKVFFDAKTGHVEKVTIMKHYPPDIKAALAWLYNRQPKRWKNRVEHVNGDGKPLVLAYALPPKKEAA